MKSSIQTRKELNANTPRPGVLTPRRVRTILLEIADAFFAPHVILVLTLASWPLLESLTNIHSGFKNEIFKIV